MDRYQEKAIGNTSPVQIGEGYKMQLQAMQDKDRLNQISAQQYASNVGSPARAKQFQQL